MFISARLLGMGDPGRPGQHAVEVACTISRGERLHERTPPHFPHSATRQGVRLRQGRRKYNDKVRGGVGTVLLFDSLYLYYNSP